MIQAIQFLLCPLVPRCGLHDLFEHHSGHASAPDPQVEACAVTVLIIFASALFVLLFCCPFLSIRVRRIRDLFWVIPLINLAIYLVSVALQPYPGGAIARFLPPGLWFTLVEVFLVLLLSLIVACLNACTMWLVRKTRGQKAEPHRDAAKTATDEYVTAALADDISSRPVAFGDARWNTRWLVVGLAVLLLWRSIGLIDREWFSQVPSWLFLIVTGLVPQVFLLIFPILTRDSQRRFMLDVPSPTGCLIELAIAIPLVIATLVAVATANYLVGRLVPGTSLAPDALKDMAKSPDHMIVYILLLFSFTFAPIAEEVFFRGFLYNAFRARMPLLVAAVAQSLIFGFGHFFGTLHGGVTFGIGLLLTAVYQWRKTLTAPILVHAGINLMWALGMLATMDDYANSAVLGVNGDRNDSQCVIRLIVPNSAAEEAGLQVGDIITAFNGEPIRDFPHLLQTVPRYRPGDAIPVTINRSGAVQEITVLLRRRGDP